MGLLTLLIWCVKCAWASIKVVFLLKSFLVITLYFFKLFSHWEIIPSHDVLGIFFCVFFSAGIYYIVFSIIFCICSFYSSPLTNSRNFATQLQRSLLDMKQLFVKGDGRKWTKCCSHTHNTKIIWAHTNLVFMTLLDNVDFILICIKAFEGLKNSRFVSWKIQFWVYNTR